jgi:hypothetical protein
MLKPLLREFLTWLEGVSIGTRQPGSPFELPLDAATVTKAQEAVALAEASGSEVRLFSGGVPAQAIIAHLVFNWAGFGADRMAQGELSQAEADSLVKAVETLAVSKLVVVEHGSPSAPDSAVTAGTAKCVNLHEPGRTQMPHR